MQARDGRAIAKRCYLCKATPGAVGKRGEGDYAGWGGEGLWVPGAEWITKLLLESIWACLPCGYLRSLIICSINGGPHKPIVKNKRSKNKTATNTQKHPGEHPFFFSGCREGEGDSGGISSLIILMLPLHPDGGVVISKPRSPSGEGD